MQARGRRPPQASRRRPAASERRAMDGEERTMSPERTMSIDGVVVVDKPARPVTVYRLDVAPTDEAGVFRLEVECSSGTYVRTLAADIGTALGGGAHLTNLRRTAIGSFTVDDATPLDDVTPQHVMAT